MRQLNLQIKEFQSKKYNKVQNSMKNQQKQQNKYTYQQKKKTTNFS